MLHRARYLVQGQHRVMTNQLQVHLPIRYEDKIVTAIFVPYVEASSVIHRLLRAVKMRTEQRNITHKYKSQAIAWLFHDIQQCWPARFTPPRLLRLLQWYQDDQLAQ